jgi:hypothetical protein
LYAPEICYVIKNTGETKIERIRYFTMRIELGIIPMEEKTELAKLKWFGCVVNLWRLPNLIWYARTQRKRPTGIHKRLE